MYDSTVLYLYYNGVLGTMAEGASASMASLPLPLTIGAGFSGGALYFQGELDEVAVYADVFTGERIIEHYCAVLPGAPVCP